MPEEQGTRNLATRRVPNVEKVECTARRPSGRLTHTKTTRTEPQRLGGGLAKGRRNYIIITLVLYYIMIDSDDDDDGRLRS